MTRPPFENSFLQSDAWERFQRQEGRATWRVGDALLIRHELRGGFNYIYAPHPYIGENKFNEFAERAEAIAKTGGGIFLKIDPLHDISGISSRAIPAQPVQPHKTSILEINRPEDDILSSMHEKTRYNIRLAAKKGVVISSGNSVEEFESFWSLLRETALRDSFHLHSRKHYEMLLAVRDGEFTNTIFSAHYRGRVIAASIVNFYKKSRVATYLHGGSSREFRDAMAPYLLHWQSILHARVNGFLFYDLWGIDQERWPGLTRFKMGFGGDEFEYPQSVDVVFRPFWYRVYRALRPRT